MRNKHVAPLRLLLVVGALFRRENGLTARVDSTLFAWKEGRKS